MTINEKIEKYLDDYILETLMRPEGWMDDDKIEELINNDDFGIEHDGVIHHFVYITIENGYINATADDDSTLIIVKDKTDDKYYAWDSELIYTATEVYLADPDSPKRVQSYAPVYKHDAQVNIDWRCAIIIPLINIGINTLKD